MNIAFGALVIFLLLFPGIIFRLAYLEGPYSRRSIQSSLVDELILSLIPAFVIQFVGYWLVETLPFLPYEVDEKNFYYLLTGQPGLDFTYIETSVVGFVCYQCVIFIISFGLGKAFRWGVLHFQLDRRFHLLRMYNEWYYALSGRLESIDSTQNSTILPDVFVDVLVETKEGSYLYCGLLKDFFLSKDNGLDRLYFEEVYRRKLCEDTTKPPTDELTPAKWLDSRYYEMPGEVFVIPYSQVKNLNIRYLYLGLISEEPTLPELPPEEN